MPLAGVNKVTAKGRVYYYHRKTGVRLHAEFGTPEFLLELQQLNGGRPAGEVRRGRPGTWGALALAYRASQQYAALAPRTRKDYEGVLDWLAGIDAMPLVQLDTAAVIAIRDRALEQKKRRFANHLLQVMGTVLEWGRLRGLAPSVNPAHRIPKVPRPKNLPRANRPWSEEETAAVLAAADGGLRVAIGLAVFAGMRGGDIPRITWAAYDGTALTWQQGKTGAEVWVPCLPELKAILDAAPRTATTIATKRDGTPMTEAGLRKAFRTLIVRLLKEGKVVPGLTLHGRRHTLGDALMELGAELSHVQAVLGQKSIGASQHYSRGASTRRAAKAAIELLAKHRFGTNRGRRLQNPVQNRGS